MKPATDPLSWLTRTHGLEAWILVYAVVAVPMLLGLIRAKAPAAKLAAFPILALPITALALLFVAMLRDALVTWRPGMAASTAFELGAHTTTSASRSSENRPPAAGRPVPLPHSRLMRLTPMAGRFLHGP